MLSKGTIFELNFIILSSIFTTLTPLLLIIFYALTYHYNTLEEDTTWNPYLLSCLVPTLMP